jgi:sensor histidine kinase YesM
VTNGTAEGANGTNFARGIRYPEPVKTRTLVASVTTFWTVSGVATASQMRTMESGVSWARALSTSLASSAMWVPLTIAIVAVVRRAPLESGRSKRAALVMMAIVAGVVFGRAGVVLALNPWIGWYLDPPTPSDVLLTSLALNLATTLLLIGLAHAIYYAERAALRERHTERLAAQLTAARLEALAAQLHPHFLFNALNSISELVHRDPAAADEAIVNLGAMLRQTVDPSLPEVSLGEEIDLARRYLSIESLRLGERLSVAYRVPREVEGARVPRLLLQPIVENAIRHGVARRTTPGRVEIAAERDGERLIIAVRDSGADPALRPGAHPSASSRSAGGVGLSNARARLRELYREHQSLEIHVAPEGGTEVRIAIPFSAAQANTLERNHDAT